MYILRFLGYYIALGLFVVVPFRHLLLTIFSTTQHNSTASTIAGVILIASYIAHIIFSHKCAIIKSNPGVSATQAVKISANEYIGFIKLALKRQ